MNDDESLKRGSFKYETWQT